MCCSLVCQEGHILILLLGQQDRQFDLKLLPSDSIDLRSLFTSYHEKGYFFHYFSSSGYSPVDENPPSDRGGGEACFRQLHSAENTHQYRKMHPLSGKGHKKDLYSCDQRSAHVSSWCYVTEKDRMTRVG